MLPERDHDFLARAMDAMGELLAAEPLVLRHAETMAQVFARVEQDLVDVIRSRYLDLADPATDAPVDLVYLAGLVGLVADTGVGTEVFRERLRLFVRAYLQGAGTPRSLLTMAASELEVLLAGEVRRQEQEGEWLLPVHKGGGPIEFLRLQENPMYLVQKEPVLAKTGTRFTVDNPGTNRDGLVRPEITVEALVPEVHGPSLIMEDIGLAWLSPGVTLRRGDRLLLRTTPEGRFVASVHAPAGIEDVTHRIELIGTMPTTEALGGSIPLQGGSTYREATALLRSAEGVRIVRLCARMPGIWGNGLSLLRLPLDQGGGLAVSFDPMLAATGQPGPRSQRTLWPLAAQPGPVSGSADPLSAAVSRLRAGQFLLQAEEASLFLPLGRSRWVYFDHFEAPDERGDLRHLARLILDYTRFGHAAHHDTDISAIFRFDSDSSTFGNASYIGEEERVRITLSWLEPRPTAVRLEVPPALMAGDDRISTGERYERLARGIRRIKPAGVATSLVRPLPDESMRITEGLPFHMTTRLSTVLGIHSRPARVVDQAEDVGLRDIAALAPALADEVVAVGHLNAGVETRVEATAGERMAAVDEPSVAMAMASRLAAAAAVMATATAETRMAAPDTLAAAATAETRMAAPDTLAAAATGHMTLSADAAHIAVTPNITAELTLADSRAAAAALADTIALGEQARYRADARELAQAAERLSAEAIESAPAAVRLTGSTSADTAHGDRARMKDTEPDIEQAPNGGDPPAQM